MRKRERVIQSERERERKKDQKRERERGERERKTTLFTSSLRASRFATRPLGFRTVRVAPGFRGFHLFRFPADGASGVASGIGVRSLAEIFISYK
jgi:hypothetical protein